MEYEQEIERYRRMLNNAVSSWDGVAYFEACEKLGVDPNSPGEYPELYEMGELENITQRLNLGLVLRDSDELRRVVRVPKKVDDFLEDAKEVNPKDISRNIPQKRAILRKRFKKFRRHGSQDIAGYSAAKVGSLFKRVYQGYAKKYGY